MFIQKVKVKVKLLSRVRLFATLWTVTHQAPPSMGFSRQEYWSGVPFPSPGAQSKICYTVGFAVRQSYALMRLHVCQLC